MRIFMNTQVYVCSLNIRIKAYTSRTYADLSGMLAYSALHTLKYSWGKAYKTVYM